MTTAEAKAKLTAEFVARYDEWFADFANLPEKEYANKYGWFKSEKTMKDNQSSYLYFGKYIYSAYAEFTEWVDAGYPREVIFELNEEKFLGSKSQDWFRYFFISQAAIKQIYKDRRERK